MAVDITPISWWKMFSSPAPASTTFTLCVWARPDRVPGVSNTESLWFMDNFSSANISQLVFANSSGSARLEAWQNAVQRVTGPTVSIGAWVFGAYVCTSGTTIDLYWRAEGASSLSTASGSTGTTPSLSEMLLGSDRAGTNAQSFSGAMAYMRYWDGSALNSTQLLAESASATAVVTTNLFADWPLATVDNDTTDASGNGHGLEWNTGTGGAQATATDPDIGIDEGTTGTVAVTLAAQTPTATGQLGYSGSVAVSQAAQTSSATGQLGYAGSSSAQQATQTSAASGQLGYSGTSGPQQASQTSSATGQLGYSGTAGATQAAQTASASGTVVEFGGTVATTQAAQTASATGQLGYSATADVTQAAQTAAASGVISITGTVAVTQAPNTASASGDLGWQEEAPVTGSWGTLMSIYREAADLAQKERDTPPVACPNDGEPLETGPDGRLWCPWDGWRPDGY